MSQNLFSKSCCSSASHKSGASLPPAVDLRGEVLTHLTNQPFHEMHLDRFDDQEYEALIPFEFSIFPSNLVRGSGRR